MSKLKAGILEAAVVGALGLVLALVGNALHPKPVTLSHNYFRALDPGPGQPGAQDRPQGKTPEQSQDKAGKPGGGGEGSQNTDQTARDKPAQDAVVEGEPPYKDSDWFKNSDPGAMQQYAGLAFVPTGSSPSWKFNELMSDQAAAFHAAGADRSIVFVDARTPEHYEEERIPGAVSLSRFHFPQYWPTAQNSILGAGAIVIYCAGGDCDDSEFLAGNLIMDGGIAQERIYIYRGGMKDWKQAGRSLEKGK